MREDEDLVKMPIRIYASDYDWLRNNFPTLGYNAVVRKIIRRFRIQSERKLDSKSEEDENGIEVHGLDTGQSSGDASLNE